MVNRKKEWMILMTLVILLVGIGIGKSNPSESNISPTPTPVTDASGVSPSPVLGLNTNIVQVIKVVDGDTITVSGEGGVETIRLIGLDTPETVDPRKPIQCFGREASSQAKSKLEGKRVVLEEDFTQGNKDRYQRLLRYVFLEDGTNFNKWMIENGYGFEYTYSTEYKYQSEFKKAQEEAKANARGLWSESACVSPTPTSTAALISPTLPDQDGRYICSCSKSCSDINTCEEAYFQLNSCGCKDRDVDGDGIPCEAVCN